MEVIFCIVYFCELLPVLERIGFFNNQVVDFYNLSSYLDFIYLFFPIVNFNFSTYLVKVSVFLFIVE